LEILGIDNLPLNISSDEFLDYLIKCIRNDVISFQRFLSKTRCTRKKTLLSEINLLKNDYQSNYEAIFNLEAILNRLHDEEMKLAIEKFRHFELVNSEKITPEFLKLANNANVEYSLDAICKDDGTRFPLEKERETFIVDQFSKTYETPPCDIKRGTNLIEKFLGPEILNNKLVDNCKLTQAERNLLDQQLGIAELDEAMEKANQRSAPGMDGLSMHFIKKFWNHLRKPLFNYAITCFEKGSLTTNFKSACIRLIPKKGDKTQIKNWRPISLLSNLYKIISRALNSRLQKIANRITTRAQKGFTDTSFIQEVLINVVESIGHANSSNIPAAIISIDMAKAFDSVSHKFLSECYSFFNFGPVFTNMLETVGRDRKACIILGNGKLSKPFDLKSGRPQGENLSPIQYNICNQIFLLKLELDPEIKSIFETTFGPRTPFHIDVNSYPVNKFFVCESERETDNAEGFTDDSTAITTSDQESINAVENALLNFEKLSGLKCNFSKSSIMFVGDKSGTDKIKNKVYSNQFN
jgi:hypothetical protein